MLPPMKTISIASQKGGSGKTTLCLHLLALAAATGPTLAIDLDPQRSLSFWHDRRGTGEPLLIPGEAAHLSTYLGAARQEGIAYCLIDLPPHDNAATAAAMRVSDLVLIPARPSALDLHAVAATVEMARTLGKPAYVVISQAPPRRGFGKPGAVLDAESVIEGMGGQVCPVAISQRVIASQSVIVGKTVSEIEPAGAAAAEFLDLWKWIERTLNNDAQTKS